jgi:uncharacterized protein
VSASGVLAALTWIVVDRGTIERIVGEYFASRGSEIAAIYLYGSVARGSDRADSDVDLGILYRTPPPSTLIGQPFGAEADLSERVGRAVHIVVMNGAPPDLVHRILRDGRLLLDNDRSARIAFEVRARMEYFDLLPILRLYRRHAEP